MVPVCLEVAARGAHRVHAAGEVLGPRVHLSLVDGGVEVLVEDDPRRDGVAVEARRLDRAQHEGDVGPQKAVRRIARRLELVVGEAALERQEGVVAERVDIGGRLDLGEGGKGEGDHIVAVELLLLAGAVGREGVRLGVVSAGGGEGARARLVERVDGLSEALGEGRLVKIGGKQASVDLSGGVDLLELVLARVAQVLDQANGPQEGIVRGELRLHGGFDVEDGRGVLGRELPAEAMALDGQAVAVRLGREPLDGGIRIDEREVDAGDGGVGIEVA